MGLDEIGPGGEGALGLVELEIGSAEKKERFRVEAKTGEVAKEKGEAVGGSPRVVSVEIIGGDVEFMIPEAAKGEAEFLGGFVPVGGFLIAAQKDLQFAHGVAGGAEIALVGRGKDEEFRRHLLIKGAGDHPVGVLHGIMAGVELDEGPVLLDSAGELFLLIISVGDPEVRRSSPSAVGELVADRIILVHRLDIITAIEGPLSLLEEILGLIGIGEFFRRARGSSAAQRGGEKREEKKKEKV